MQETLTEPCLPCRLAKAGQGLVGKGRGGESQYLRPNGVQSRSGRCKSLSCCPSSGLEGSNSPISKGNRLTYLQLHAIPFSFFFEIIFLCFVSALSSAQHDRWNKAPSSPPTKTSPKPHLSWASLIYQQLFKVQFHALQKCSYYLLRQAIRTTPTSHAITF